MDVTQTHGHPEESGQTKKSTGAIIVVVVSQTPKSGGLAVEVVITS
jgi:hypothetical protein